ncbi:MAG: hypothetical protein FJW20_17430 [Acidimicrobiia bacterium]|nr:hypothetical protein [Acidimicrobiia bacterium]
MKPIALLLLAALSALGQEPVIGLIDFYGVRKASRDQLRAALGVKEGDKLPRSKGETEERLEKVNNIVHARLEAICCEEGKAILYVGVEEKGAPHFDYFPPPEGAAMLPLEIHDEYVQFLAAVGLALRAGETAEDLSQGHSLMANAGCRKHQERFIPLAETHLEKLREVIRNSFDEEHRAIAAYVIGYAPKNARVIPQVVADLQHALRDPDDTVRNNAMRSLGALAVMGAKKPEKWLSISPTWLIEMLHSLIWQDRTTAAGILVTLTEPRDAELLTRMKTRGLEPLVEMASWKHLPHALPAFLLLGRLAGMTDEAIKEAWLASDRAARVKKMAEQARP